MPVRPYQNLQGDTTGLPSLVIGNGWVQYKGRVHALCYYWPATSEKFAMKVAAKHVAKRKRR